MFSRGLSDPEDVRPASSAPGSEGAAGTASVTSPLVPEIAGPTPANAGLASSRTSTSARTLAGMALAAAGVAGAFAIGRMTAPASEDTVTQGAPTKPQASAIQAAIPDEEPPPLEPAAKAPGPQEAKETIIDLDVVRSTDGQESAPPAGSLAATGVPNGPPLGGIRPASARTPTVGFPVVGDPFPEGEARAALSSAATQAKSCRRPGDRTGKAVVTVTFSPSGRATTATVEGDFAGSRVGGCIASKLRRVTVPPFGGEFITVRKSFELE